MSSFASLDILEPIQRAVAEIGYETMTPIQAQAIPPLLRGRDVLGCAQTGTGKTAAFLLPILHQLASQPSQGKPQPRALVLTPTRELAAQIGESFQDYASFLPLRHQVIFGGVSQKPQVASLRRGVDVIVATPGRFLDLYDQGYIDLSKIRFFVLDEADRMLDMGFIRDIRKVLALLPKRRQNLLFSATMPDAIVKLASAFLSRPVRVEVDPQSTTVERIGQQVMFVTRTNKKHLLRQLLDDEAVESAIVFTRTKHGANRVAKDLIRNNIESAAIHGNKSQGARTRALAGFKSGEIRVLVATDIAARGIDVDCVSHVFNYDLPNIAESYVHRIGRTGRAGRSGLAIAFCDDTETDYLRDIEKLTGQKIEVVHEQPFHDPAIQEATKSKSGKSRSAPTKGRASRKPRNNSGGSGRRGRPRQGGDKGVRQGSTTATSDTATESGSSAAQKSEGAPRRRHWSPRRRRSSE